MFSTQNQYVKSNTIFNICFTCFSPASCRAVTRSSLEREVRVSNLGTVKLDTVLPMARHRYDISSKGAVLPGGNDAEPQTRYTLRRTTASIMKG